MFHLRNTFTNILALEMASPGNRHRAASVVSAHYIIACLTSSREVGLTDCSRGTPAHGLSELVPAPIATGWPVSPCVCVCVCGRSLARELRALSCSSCGTACAWEGMRQTDRRTGGQCDASSDTRGHRSLQPVTAESTTLAPQRGFHAGAGRGGHRPPNRG